MSDEVLEAGLGNFEMLFGNLHRLVATDLIRTTLALALDICLGIFTGLFDITGNIKGVSRRFRDGQAVVKSDAAWNGAEADNDAPHLVHG